MYAKFGDFGLKEVMGYFPSQAGLEKWCENPVFKIFYAPQLEPAGTAEARISYGNSVCPSVCPSVCHDPVVYQAQVR